MAEEDLYRARLDKVEALRERGEDAWRVRYDRTHTAADLQDQFADLGAGQDSGKKVSVAGRLTSSRTQGRIAFGDLVDGTGKIQLFVPADHVEAFEALDSGDVAGASGEVVRTKRGELSVRTDEIVLLAKALRAPPDKWHGVKDTEIRFRQRYLDLIANPDARRIARLRVDATQVIRRNLDARGFVEVETPVLHPIPGGGFAHPFVTHFNALNQDMYLRIATELYLKRLIIGGLERVYEIGRTFRNEGLGYKYNPEFTMLEAYQAYADYHDMMELVQSLVQDAARQTTGSTAISFRGHDVDLGGDWKRVTMHEIVSAATGSEVTLDTTVDELREICERFDLPVEQWWSAGMLVGELYDGVAEKTIIEPTIVYDYPVETSPLARRHRDDPRLVERFEPVVCGTEIANAFSELNDPLEQRRRFEAQMEARAHGHMEAQPMDEPFIRALEYGMPPTGGLGLGIDRLVMMLAGVDSIREVILFPALRPESDAQKDEIKGEEGEKPK